MDESFFQDLFNYMFLSFILAGWASWVFLAALGLSLVVVIRANLCYGPQSSLAVASLAVEHGLQAPGIQ